jgi:hypothetical protein
MDGKPFILLLSLILTPGITSMTTTTQLSSAQYMPSPASGIPLSVKQVEAHSVKQDDGSCAIEYTVASQQYRDSDLLPENSARENWSSLVN